MDYQLQIKKEKNLLRKNFSFLLKQLSSSRREFAKNSLVGFFEKFLNKPTTILSFISLSSEINTQKLNKFLVKTHFLFLPSFQNKAHVFKVNSEDNLSNLLTYKDYLPDQKIFYPQVILVPGLAFSTTTKHRLGYGSGWYDIYLSSLPSSSLSIGIGFQEQKYNMLPFTHHDIPLKKLFLF